MSVSQHRLARSPPLHQEQITHTSGLSAYRSQVVTPSVQEVRKTISSKISFSIDCTLQVPVYTYLLSHLCSRSPLSPITPENLYVISKLINFRPTDPPTMPPCRHSFKEIQSPNSILNWRCSACQSGPHWMIWECLHCKIKRCRPCVAKG